VAQGGWKRVEMSDYESQFRKEMREEPKMNVKRVYPETNTTTPLQEDYRLYMESLRSQLALAREMLKECIYWLGEDGIDKRFWTDKYTEFRERLDAALDGKAGEGR
jgi:hypothetical protein